MADVIGFISEMAGYTGYFVLQTLVSVAISPLTVWLFQGRWIPRQETRPGVTTVRNTRSVPAWL